jgi:CubicO group peptidase (beta-lactamase class C family)
MKKLLPVFLLSFILFFGCKDEECCDNPIPASTYYPPNSGTWETTSPIDLNWDTSNIPELLTLLETNGTRAFMVIKDGKIVMENYWGKGLLNVNDFNKDLDWYWASAGKTLTSCMVGKAQEEGFLSLSDKTSKYLGNGWTSLTTQQEDKITIKHQLTMTTGLDDSGLNSDKTDPVNLKYVADAGNRWAYHNAPYTLLDTVVESAVGQNFEDYFNLKLRDRIGMNGYWFWLGDNHVYFSTARSMARYGYLILNNGEWNDEQIINEAYVTDMVTRSQQMNNAYGYLWWLNGSETYMLPGSQIVLPGSFTPNGPTDMYAGMGKNGQYVCVVPSMNLILVRMGENPDNALVPILFLNDIWGKLNKVIS